MLFGSVEGGSWVQQLGLDGRPSSITVLSHASPAAITAFASGEQIVAQSSVELVNGELRHWMRLALISRPPASKYVSSREVASVPPQANQHINIDLLTIGTRAWAAWDERHEEKSPFVVRMQSFDDKLTPQGDAQTVGDDPEGESAPALAQLGCGWALATRVGSSDPPKAIRVRTAERSWDVPLPAMVSSLSRPAMAALDETRVVVVFRLAEKPMTKATLRAAILSSDGASPVPPVELVSASDPGHLGNLAGPASVVVAAGKIFIVEERSDDAQTWSEHVIELAVPAPGSPLDASAMREWPLSRSKVTKSVDAGSLTTVESKGGPLLIGAWSRVGQAMEYGDVQAVFEVIPLPTVRLVNTL